MDKPFIESVMHRHLHKKLKRQSWLLVVWGMFGFSVAVSGQSIDSLILKHTDANGKVNMDSLRVIGKRLLYGHPDSAVAIARQMIDLSTKQKETLPLGNSYRLLAAYYADIENNWEFAYFYNRKAGSLYRSIGWKKGEGDVIHNYGVIK